MSRTRAEGRPLPRFQSPPQVAFLAAPMTSFLNMSTLDGVELRKFLTRIASTLQAAGYVVKSAHIAEAWGRERRPPEAGFPYDAANLREATLVVAYLGVPLSPGVQLELGMAYALNKPTVVIQHEDADLPYMVRGLVSNLGATLIRFASADSAVVALESYLRNVRPRPH